MAGNEDTIHTITCIDIFFQCTIPLVFLYNPLLQSPKLMYNVFARSHIVIWQANQIIANDSGAAFNHLVNKNDV